MRDEGGIYQHEVMATSQQRDKHHESVGEGGLNDLAHVLRWSGMDIYWQTKASEFGEFRVAYAGF